MDWKPHPYHDDIIVSEFGDVLSYKSGRWFELKPSNNGTGYIRVGVGHSNPTYVHILVAETYLDPVDPTIGLEVNHVDGVKTNNHFSNLEWVTKGENELHAYRLGLKKAWNRRRIRIIETGEVFESARACARAIEGDQRNIAHCLAGNRRTHRGFTFEYI